ncbi:hypothetical protein [Bifidobacterium scaligerum]|uniref:Uncharacterized protein n=1 Tax=Bifidobacterium scaligerum TaxID=2052656 RepID=A0A2M9HT75_9BIFI|nr:hypothetical protein [Bifidobacterium scaligerum]PJM80016.1 hypothetical protein CUU80_02465 [Bifidobacterium scaligerum]
MSLLRNYIPNPMCVDMANYLSSHGGVTNCTIVNVTSDYQPPSLYPGFGVETAADGDAWCAMTIPDAPRETPLVIAANMTPGDDQTSGPALFDQWMQVWGGDSTNWSVRGSLSKTGVSGEFTIPAGGQTPQIVFRSPAKAGQRIYIWNIYLGTKADWEALQGYAPGAPLAGSLMPL